ncbi:hypothetical protein D3P04_19785 [Paracoccus onubensis]|uniref:Uncharacterized protein n=1 Tax=Paracoccus onubensis TaxID=1675788 RepID=A0A418SN71_9RHOB|nr:hypothetical protein D3P04_19785 [Paracoccus onubensis]
MLRSLVQKIELTPDMEGHELQIEVHGDLAGILTIALERKKTASGAGGSQLVLVAGACNLLK